MKTRLMSVIGIAVLLATAGITSCNKDANEMGRMQVRMMDASSPYNYESVYLDVQRVEVHVESESGGGEWLSLTTAAGTYDMLSLVNGADILLADQEIPTGTVSQIRLVLGSGNTIVVDGNSYPLTIPSGSESGLKINVHEFIDENETYALMLDFDAAHSITAQGSGTYHLQPVIRAIVLRQTGAIQGEVAIPDRGIAVVAESGAGSFSTYADRATGSFMLRGLAPGTYTVKIFYPASDIPVIIPDVHVEANAVVDIGLQ